MSQEKTDLVLIGAMPQEIAAYRNHIANGEWHGRKVEVVKCGIGKVAASSATTKAILDFKPRHIIFTGVGGALDEELTLGKIGLGLAVIDADVDARGLDSSYRQGQLPFQETRWYSSDSKLVDLAHNYDGGKDPLVPVYIATRDTFMNSTKKALFNVSKRESLQDYNQSRLRVPWMCDMESSAVLQVAKSYIIPSLVLRVVSDTLKGNAAKDFNVFIKESIKHYLPVVDHLVKNLP